MMKFADPCDPTPFEFEIWNKAIAEICGKSQTFTAKLTVRITIYLTKSEYENHLREPEDFVPENIPDYGFDNALHETYIRKFTHNAGSEWRVLILDGKQPIARRYENFLVTFCEPFELENFPFDIQILNMNFSISTCDRFELVSAKYDLDYKFIEPIVGWNFIEEFHDLIVKQEGFQTVITVKMASKRATAFFAHKVIVIMSLLTCTVNMSILIEPFEEALGFIMTIFLTQIAYLYVVQEHLPLLSHSTIMDYFTIGSIWYSFAMVAECFALKVSDDSDGNVDLSTRYALFHVNLAFWLCGTAVFGFYCWKAKQAETLKVEQMMNGASAERKRSEGWKQSQNNLIESLGIKRKTMKFEKQITF